MLPQWIYLAQIFITGWLTLANAQNNLPTEDTGYDYGMCDAALGQYPPLSTGKCADGTAWVEEYECCVKCIFCQAGFRKLKVGCHGECVECEKGTFSSPPYNQEDTCHPCTACPSLHRQVLTACQKDQDSHCGSCLQGYYMPEDQRSSRSVPSPCNECTHSSQHENCEGIGSSPGALQITNQDNGEDANNMPVVIGAVAGLLVLIVIIIVVILLVRRRRKRRKQEEVDIKEVEEQYPLQYTDIETPDIIKRTTPDNSKVKDEVKEERSKQEIVNKKGKKEVKDSEVQANTKESPTVEIKAPKGQLTPTRRVKFQGSPLHAVRNKRNGYEKAQSSDEDEYLPGKNSPDDFKTAIGYPLGGGLSAQQERAPSFQSIDDDDDAAAAWGYFSGANKSGSDTEENNSHKPIHKAKEYAAQDFSSLPSY